MDLDCYSKGKVYKVVCNITGKVYIGSTCKELSNRLAGHRSAYKKHLAGKGNYVSSFEIIKNGNYDIVLLELVNAKNKMELHQRERHYIDTIDCVNKVIPTRNKNEYRVDNADKIKQQKKQYRVDNADKIKQYRIDNADKIIEQTKLYRTNNTDKIKEYAMQYRIDNSDKIKEAKNKHIDCECGGCYTHTHKASHLRTQKHCQYIQQQQPIV
jgi:hypothetical protein